MPASEFFTVGPKLELAERVDGSRQFAILTGDGAVTLANVHDVNHTKTLFQKPGNSVTSCPLAWSTKGDVLYHASDQLYAITPDTGSTVAVTSFGTEKQYSVTWFLEYLPTENALVFLQRGKGPGLPSAILHLDLQGHQLTRIFEGDKDTLLWSAACRGSSDHIVVSLRRQSQWSLWLCSRSGLLRKITDLSTAVTDMSISAKDGDVAYAVDGEGIYRLGLHGGATQQLLIDHGTMPAWSPDGSRLAFLEDDYELNLLSLHGKPDVEKLVWTLGEHYPAREYGRPGWASPVRWSQDGRYLAFRLAQSTKPLPGEFTEGTTQDAQGRVTKFQSPTWGYRLACGIVDFHSGHVSCHEGHYYDLAWRPAEHSA